jgi:hypothetical protein
VTAAYCEIDHRILTFEQRGAEYQTVFPDEKLIAQELERSPRRLVDRAPEPQKHPQNLICRTINVTG